MEEHSDGGAGPSSFCSRAEGQSFAEADAVFTEADTAAPPIVDHRFIESPARIIHRGTFPTASANHVSTMEPEFFFI